MPQVSYACNFKPPPTKTFILHVIAMRIPPPVKVLFCIQVHRYLNIPIHIASQNVCMLFILYASPWMAESSMMD